MFKLLLILIFVVNIILVAQENKSFPLLDNSIIPEAEISEAEYYKGEALWGLINGGADLYLEYGFDEIKYQQIDWKENNFKVETYKMDSAEAAFGIFSVSRYRCTKSDTLTKFICITPYQVQAAVDQFYFSISNNKGNPEAQDLSVELFSRLLKQIENKSLKIPEVFGKPEYSTNLDELKFISGKIGLSNNFSRWDEFFEAFSNYSFYVLPVKKDVGFINIGVINFDSEQDADKFINQNSTCSEEISKAVKPLSTTEFVFIETNLPENEWKALIE